MNPEILKNWEHSKIPEFQISEMMISAAVVRIYIL